MLLAEDNKINQVVAVGTLKKLGYVVDIVEDGGQAVAACAAEEYDAVLMDVMMPGVDGYPGDRHDQRARAGQRPGSRSRSSAWRPGDGRRPLNRPRGRENSYLTKPLRTSALEEVLGRWIDRSVVVD
ncbi:MAG: response regulator [Acidimicrobiales bacterium]